MFLDYVIYVKDILINPSYAKYPVSFYGRSTIFIILIGFSLVLILANKANFLFKKDKYLFYLLLSTTISYFLLMQKYLIRPAFPMLILYSLYSLMLISYLVVIKNKKLINKIYFLTVILLFLFPLTVTTHFNANQHLESLNKVFFNPKTTF
jgi:hypothetical protein